MPRKPTETTLCSRKGRRTQRNGDNPAGRAERPRGERLQAEGLYLVLGRVRWFAGRLFGGRGSEGSGRKLRAPRERSVATTPGRAKRAPRLESLTL